MEHNSSGSHLAEILRRLNEVERRLDALEASPGDRARSTKRPATSAPRTPAAAQGTSAAPQAPQVGASLTLIGRTLVVLGGAFLLRAITESGLVPQSLGMAMGLLYALFWFSLADRAAGKQQRLSAGYHGLAASIIAFPLLWEATAKFKLLSPLLSTCLLLAVAAVGFAVAWHRQLGSLAWLATIGSVATAWVLAFVTRMFFPFISCILLVGFITLWLAYLLNWRGLAFFTACIANLSVLFMTTTLFTGQAGDVQQVIRDGELLTLQLGLLAVYLASIGARTMSRGREVTILEILQAAGVFSIGMGGAILLMQRTGSFGSLLGGISLALAVTYYTAAFLFIDRRRGARRNFIFYSTAALCLTLVSLSALLAGTALAIAFAVVALFTAWLGASRARATLSGHGAFFLVASAVAAGLLTESVAVFSHITARTELWLSPAALVLIVVAGACFWFPVATHGRTWGRLTRLPKIVVLVVLFLLVNGLVMSVGTELIVRGSDPSQQIATAAAVRTGVLATLALLLAWLGRRPRFLEATWLLYVVLATGAVKLLLEDLRSGRPATLFVSLVLYGGALIIAPRLARRST